jgi:RNA polymerase sigma-70 factor, ECF subfamily
MTLGVGPAQVATAAGRSRPAAPGVLSVEDAYDEYRDQLYGYLVSLTRDRETSQDLLHESYARLAHEVLVGRAPQNVRAWLYQVARNLVVSRGRRQQVAERWMNRQSESRLEASAEEHYLLREASVELRGALLELSPADRTALLMAAQGYSGAEIAQAVGRSSAAIRTRLCRARGRLRDLLQPTGSKG